MTHTGQSLATLILLSLTAGILAAPLLLRISRKRAEHQPLEAHVEHEKAILSTILNQPQLYPLISQLQADHLVNQTRGRIWEMIKAAAGEFPASDNREHLLQLGKEIDPELKRQVLANLNRTDRAIAEEVLADHALVLNAEDLLDAASDVYSAGIDRTEFSGRSSITATDDDTRPLVRTTIEPTLFRRILATALTTLGMLTSVLVGVSQETTTSGILAAAALVTLTVGSVIWTLVDLDTMYVDLTSFLGISTVAGILTVVHALVTRDPWPAIWGLTVAGGIILFIELANRVYRRVRHQHGMGGGDYMLIVPTIGIPSALTGDWVLGQWILILSLLTGIVGWVGHRVTVKGFTRHSPYPFGPYLASGWILATLLWTIGR